MRTPALAAFIGFALMTSAAAEPIEDFVAACSLSGKTSPESCRCQAHLAKGSFSAAEMKLAILGVRGDQAAFRAGLGDMGKAKAGVFLAKMRALAAKVSSACS